MVAVVQPIRYYR